MKPATSAVLIVGSHLTSTVAVMLTQILLAKYLTPSEFGVWVSLMAKINIFVPIAIFGLTPFWVSASSQGPMEIGKYVYPTLKLLGLLSIAIIVALIWVADFIIEDQYRTAYLFMCSLVFAYTFSTIITTKYQIEELYVKQAIWTALPNSARFIIIIGFLSFTNTPKLDGVAEIYLISSIIIILAATPALMKLINNGPLGKTPGVAVSSFSINNIFCKMSKFGLADISWIIYSQGILIVLGFTASYEEIAEYSLGLLLVNSFYMIPSLYYQKLKLKNINERLHIDRGVLFAEIPLMVFKKFIIGVVLAFGVIGFGIEIIHYLYDSKYKAVGGVVAVMAFAIPFKLIESYVGAILTSGEFIEYKFKVALMFGMAVPLITFVVVTYFGILGAVYIYVISEALMALLFLCKVLNVRYFR